jgi:hypothetical protein
VHGVNSQFSQRGAVTNREVLLLGERRMLAGGFSADRSENLLPGRPEVLVHRPPGLLGIAGNDGLDDGIVPVPSLSNSLETQE